MTPDAPFSLLLAREGEAAEGVAAACSVVGEERQPERRAGVGEGDREAAHVSRRAGARAATGALAEATVIGLKTERR
jgi:hypothetical protein